MSVLDWLLASEHWSGEKAIPIRLLQHVEMCVLAIVIRDTDPHLDRRGGRAHATWCGGCRACRGTSAGPSPRSRILVLVFILMLWVVA